MSIFDKHQLKIARDILKFSDEGAFIMGGMTKDEARRIIAAHRNKSRRERDAALRSLGMTKVRGALGGTYWE